MELVINISKWPENSPLEHIGTDIIIKDENDVALFPEERMTNNVWVKEIDIPVGSTYYVTERKIFKLRDLPEEEQTLTYESVVHTVTNDDTSISNMILKEYVEIEKPTVILKLKDIEESENFVKIRTSSYRGKGDGHTHTHWLVIADGSIVLRSLRDSINKTSIDISKDKISFENKLEILVVHCSNNIESETEHYVIDKNTLNLKVVSNLINVPLMDYILNIEKIDYSRPMKLSKVYIKHADKVLKVYEINGDNNAVNLTIPKKLLDSNSILNIELYGYGSDDALNKRTYKLITYNLGYEDNINKDYVYTKSFYKNKYNTLVPKGLVTDTLNNNFIVPTENGFSSKTFSIAGGIINVSVLSGLNHLGNLTNMLVKVLNDNEILIDCLDNKGIPTFLIYEHTNINNSNVYILKHMLSRPDETKTLAYNNSIEQISNDEFIYSVYGTNKLRKYNKNTNTFKDLKPLNVKDTTTITIMKMDDNQLLCFSNNDLRTKIYNIEKNKYVDGMMHEFGYLNNSDIKKVDLINGDKLLLVNTKTENKNKVLYFDISEYTLKELDYIISNTDNSVLIRDKNNVLIGRYIDKEYDDLLSDKLEITRFI